MDQSDFVGEALFLLEADYKLCIREFDLLDNLK